MSKLLYANPPTAYPYKNSPITLRVFDPDAVANIVILFWIALIATKQNPSLIFTDPNRWLLVLAVPMFLAAALSLAPRAASPTGRLMQRLMVMGTGLSTLVEEHMLFLISSLPFFLAACVLLMNVWCRFNVKGANHVELD